MFYNTAKKEALNLLKCKQNEYNKLGEHANDYILKLYETRKSAVKAIERVESYVNSLANTPKEYVKEISEIKITIKEFTEALTIEKENSNDNIKGASGAIGGVAAGALTATMGPTAAMAIATTFGTASTGTAIASLSGAAATNAALAWLGGGALAAGGGGMSAGSAFLAMAGPLGWALAGIAIAGSSIFAIMKNKQAAEKANDASKKIEESISLLKPKFDALVRLYTETDKLKSGINISKIVNTFPNDYSLFNEEQKNTLITLINNVSAMGKLINKRI